MIKLYQRWSNLRKSELSLQSKWNLKKRAEKGKQRIMPWGQDFYLIGFNDKMFALMIK